MIILIEYKLRACWKKQHAFFLVKIVIFDIMNKINKVRSIYG